MARRRRPSPLPVRAGLNPARLRVDAGPWQASGETVADYLAARFPDDAARLRAAVGAGEVVDELGRPFTPSSRAVPGSLVYLYRDPPTDEPHVPFDVEVLHEDDDLLVVDKPHFLATTPRGVNVVETVLVRLRTATGNDELSPVHRLDRATAGVLVLTKRAAVRGVYQMLFQERQVTKVYEAVAPVRAGLALPVVVRSRIVKTPGVLAAYEVDGEPNSETLVELARSSIEPERPSVEPAETRTLGRYRLTPRTGKTHQLRLHMSTLGIPIHCDDLYPVVLERAREDFSDPLQLLARSIAFIDPISGAPREFVSRRRLDALSAD